jgi:mannonate dehydratase
MGVENAIAKLAPEMTDRPPPWDPDALQAAVDAYAAGGFRLVGLEGDQFDMSRIKLGRAGRDEDIDRYCAMLRAMGRLGIRLLCLNFMVGIGWYRTRTAVAARGGALVTGFSAADADAAGPTPLGSVSEAAVWEAWRYFITRVAPVAEDAGVRMGLHPDDPPLSPLRGIGRILTSVDAWERALDIAASPAVGVTFCQGTIETMGEAPIEALRRFGRDRIAFVHVRNIAGSRRDFVETFPEAGQTDMVALARAYAEMGLDCYVRPDHAPAMDGDRSHDGAVDGINVGYEANGMIYALGYLRGLLSGVGAIA